MKSKFKEVRPARTRSYLKHKLISATAMLLVSSILMVSTSYAWYVLSTAPEVSNIKTQVGANGALEIALLNADSWETLSLLEMGDIDESLAGTSASTTAANLTWGNLVNLEDKSYGLSDIVLNPARLNITQDGDSSAYKVIGNMLKTPVYGEDGRVKSLSAGAAVAYTYSDGGFRVKNDYGVRAIGTIADMSTFELGMSDARSKLDSGTTDARTAASSALNSTGSALASIVVDYAINKVTEFDKEDVTNIRLLAEGLDGALDEIESALRYAFAGYIATKDAYYMSTDEDGESVEVLITSDNYQTKLEEITDEENPPTLAALYAEYPGILTVIAGNAEKKETDDIKEYIDKLSNDQGVVADAIAECEAKEKGTETVFTWDQLAAIIYPLVNTEKMTVAGSSLSVWKEKVEGTTDLSSLLNEVLGSEDGLTVVVPSGSGVLSNIADFAGNYQAEVTVAKLEYGTIKMSNVSAKMKAQTDFNPVHLTDCSNKLRSADLAEADESSSPEITDFYGYAIDLAFRTNAEESDLLLQTDPQNRVYSGENQAGLQGGGSYMTFSVSGGLSCTKLVKLMDGIRVVFMDESQNVLGIAKLDTTLVRSNYKEITDSDGEGTGTYYLDGTAGTYQNSDLISEAAYLILPETDQAVTFNKTTGKATAKLYLYNFERTTSKDADGEVRYEDEENGIPYYTGGLTINSKRSDAVITALTQDVPQKVTALVYLDGSFVDNSSVAANSLYSMTGTLNLQFSSSAVLMPANNTQLKEDTSGVIYTEFDSDLYKVGYYVDTAKTLYQFDVTRYKIYEGSDSKIYYYDLNDTSETATYNVLTTESGVLTQVKATLSADETTIAAEGTATLTATLDSSYTGLTIVNCAFVKTGDGDGTYTTYTVSSNVATVTGVAAGTGVYHATMQVKISTGEIYNITSDPVTITVS